MSARFNASILNERALAALKPSLTYWSRLEPRPRNPTLEEPLSVPVRDALWFITRQWQLGEFRGEDAASPAYTQVKTRAGKMTACSANGHAPQPIDVHAPLEPRVEHEALTPDLALRVELGQTFEALLSNAAAVATYRAQFPIQKPTDNDPAAARFFSVCAGRACDGVAIYQAIQTHAPLPPTLATVLDEFTAWVETVFGEIGESDPDAWDPERLEYNVTVQATLPTGEGAILSAQPARDGGFDWHAFDLISTTPADAGPPAATTASIIPSRVRFRGMPNARWWDFENNITDFGGIDVQKQDLAKLAVMDFLLVHGNDWFVVPLETSINSITAVETLLVRDVFGGLTTIDRADRDNKRWTMFSTTPIAADDAPANFFILPPTAADAVQSGLVIEDMRLLRDPTANMVWGVEHLTEGTLGEPRLGDERDIQDRRNVVIIRPTDASAVIRYEIETRVPEQWIPFLPVALSPNNITGEIALQQGAMLPQGLGAPIAPVGKFLRATLRLREEEVPRIGVRATRVLARTRWTDGSTHLWIARRKSAGLGEGSSGLKFDLAVPVETTTEGFIPPEELGAMPEFLISMTGQAQGAFNGETTEAGQTGKMVGMGFAYGVQSPRDPATGQPTGRRVHKPIRFIKEWGAASPQILTALFNGETLTNVLFEFRRTNAQGALEIFYTIQLTNAAVASVNEQVDATRQPGQPLDDKNFDSVELVFESITFTFVPGGVTASDTFA